jgi:hypothetical protein
LHEFGHAVHGFALLRVPGKKSVSIILIYTQEANFLHAYQGQDALAPIKTDREV